MRNRVCQADKAITLPAIFTSASMGLVMKYRQIELDFGRAQFYNS
jgi:hypothetical protein